MRRLVFFDLDGTLANTARLPAGRRTPWQVLAPGADGVASRWGFSEGVRSTPSTLMARGYVVVVVTRAPLPYASSLLHLLGIQVDGIIAPTGGSVEDKVRIMQEACRVRSTEPSDATYVGDLSDDREIARRVGCDFLQGPITLPNDSSGVLPPVRAERLVFTAPTAQHSLVQGDRFEVAGVEHSFQQLMAALRESLCRAVPDERYHLHLLDVLFQHPGLLPTHRAALCFMTLAQHPSISERRTLQHGVLGGVDESWRPCLVRPERRGLMQVFPWLVTRDEIAFDEDLEHRYMRAISRLFPLRAVRGLPVVPGDPPIHAVMPYHQDGHASPWAEKLRTMKQYGGQLGSTFSSGPEVELGGLEFIADTIAAGLWGSPHASLCPVPSRPPSERHPGEVSLRLARLVGERLRFPVVHAVSRQDDGALVVDGPSCSGKSFVLIDDQLTHGTSVTRTARLLQQAGARIREVVVFTAGSSRGHITVDPLPTSMTCGMAAVRTHLGTPCACQRRP